MEAIFYQKLSIALLMGEKIPAPVVFYNHSLPPSLFELRRTSRSLEAHFVRELSLRLENVPK
jgi:hypothetical protein